MSDTCGLFRTTSVVRVLAALFGSVIALAMLAPGTLAAPLIGKDGRLHACYVVHGKPKGALRVVPGRRHCKRGERKVAWKVLGPTGPAGQSGPGGQAGSDGSANSALAAQVDALTARVDSLEATLQGITNSDLTGALGKLSGVTGTQLTDAVASVPKVNSLCAQTAALTDQTNLLQTAIGGLSLNGVLTGLGGVLNIPTLPTPLAPYSCP